MEGGWPEETRVPLWRVELCDEVDGRMDGLGVEPEDWRVLLLPGGTPGAALEPAGSSEVVEPSSGDVAPTPDIRSNVAGRLVVRAVSGPGPEPGPESNRTFLSTEVSVGVEAAELGFRFKADRGNRGGTNTVAELVPLAVVVATSGETFAGGGRGGLSGVGETATGKLEMEGTSKTSKV